MASARQITDSSLWLVESPNPYRIGDLDYVKLSQEESLKFYLERHSSKLGKGNSSSNPINSALRKMSEGTLDNDISQELLQAGFIVDSLAVGDNEQEDQQVNWAGSKDGTIGSPSWTSGSASMVVAPVASTISSELCTGLPGSVSTSAPAIVDTVRPGTSEAKTTSVPQVTTVVVQLPLARIQESPATSLTPVVSTISMQLEIGAQGTAYTSVESSSGSQPWVWVPGSTAKSVPQAISTSGPQTWTRAQVSTAASALPVSIARSQSSTRAQGTTVTSTLPTGSTSSQVIIACQPSPKASDACPLDLSKPVKCVEKKRSLFGTSSSCEKSESGALDLRVQVAPMQTSTVSDGVILKQPSVLDLSKDTDALDHPPKPQEPNQTDHPGVQPEGNGESDIEEDILPQLLEREVADVNPQ